MSKNYYDILGVSKTSTQKEITKSYRSLAMKYHPDKFSGKKFTQKEKKEAEDKFKEITEAYDTLKDENKRKQYDFTGSTDGFAGGGSDGFSFDFGDMDIGDMFSSFFGGGGRKSSASQKGRDLSFELDISLDQAYNGYQARIKIPKLAKCDTCKGVGSTEPPVTCAQCHGKGTFFVRHGFMNLQQSCSSCGGAGKRIKSKCKSCSGAGNVQRDKEIDINIPQGVLDKQEIRIIGEGNDGKAGPGDLYVRINVLNHSIFTRVKSDLYCAVNVSPAQAVNGGSVEIQSISNKKITVQIPSGIQYGEKLKIPQHGMISGRYKGDLYVKVLIRIPNKKTMSNEQLKLWKALSELESLTSNGEDGASSFENIKKMFNKWAS